MTKAGMMLLVLLMAGCKARPESQACASGASKYNSNEMLKTAYGEMDLASLKSSPTGTDVYRCEGITKFGYVCKFDVKWAIGTTEGTGGNTAADFDCTHPPVK